MSQTKAQLIDTLVASLLPASDSSVDIGSNAVRFANIYGDTLYGNGANLTGINTDLVSDTSPQLGGDLDVNGHRINVPDLSGADNVIYIGTGSDLQLYHASGGNSYVDDYGSGELLIRGSVVSINKQGSAEVMAKFTQDGAAELYYDNTLRLETRANDVKFHGGLIGVDDVKLQLGNSGDLQLYHDGSASYIKNFDGRLRIVGAGGTDQDIQLQAKNGEFSVRAVPHAQVELYYDHSKKFETTSTGATLTGTLIADGLTLYDNEKLLIGTNTDIEVFHDGTNSIFQSDTGDLQINSGNSAGNVEINLNNNVAGDTRETSAKFIKNGAVELYYDNVKKFETTSAGILTTGTLVTNLDGGTAGKGQLAFGASGRPFIEGFDSGNHGSGATMNFRTGAGDYMAIMKFDGAVELYHDNSKKFQTYSSGIQFFGNIKNETDGTNQGMFLGAANDFQFYHDGNRSAVNNRTGDLRLLGAGNIILGRADGGNTTSYDEQYISCTSNGAVELYYDNAKMLSTESRGAILQKADTCTFIIGSTNAGGANLFLDGDSNGDGNGGDYCGIRGTSDGHLVLFADNPNTNAIIYFQTGNGNDRWFMNADGHFLPNNNNAYDIGSTSLRVRNIYTNDLNLSNEGSSNDVDGTWGSYTIQEGAEDLFLVNKRNGKKYKFNLTEVS